MNSTEWDVIIIGAGAAGLLAAVSASQQGGRVLVLEKNRKIGVKILMSGGTRCNITHDCDVRGIISAFGKQGKFLHSALAAFGPRDIITQLNALGLATKVESTGKIFPVSNSAVDVRDTLVHWARQSGAEIWAGQAVAQLAKQDDHFQVTTEGQTLTCRSVIITTGGISYPGCGTTGDGYRWAEEFGHSIVPTYPALTPVLSSADWVKSLKGITIENVFVQVQQANEPVPVVEKIPGGDGENRKQKKHKPFTILDQRQGSLLFTHWGLSGPVILDVSREIARHPQRNRLALICDFLPDQSDDKLMTDLLENKIRNPRQTVSHLLPDVLPRRFQEQMLELSDIDLNLRKSDLSKQSLLKLVDVVKRSKIQVAGTLGFEKAEVTSGGVDLAEVDSKTMESKRVPNLFFAGEILDLDGRIGGYNFQAAFSTGFLAGKSSIQR